MIDEQKIIDETSQAIKRVTDLQDMLDDGVPYEMASKIRVEIAMLEDLIFSNQDFLESSRLDS